MTTMEYREMSKTAEGRKQVHGVMLNEIVPKWTSWWNRHRQQTRQLAKS